MLIILAIGIVLLVILAKHGNGKRRYLSRFPISETVAGGTLGDQAFSGTDFDDTFSRDHFAVSLKATFALDGVTGGEGPIHVIIAHSDYSDLEVTEWWVATNAWTTSDKIAQERKRRKCRHVGTFQAQNPNEVLNNGVMMTIPLRFVVESGNTLQLGLVNDSGATLTTGAVIKCQGNIWARPL